MKNNNLLLDNEQIIKQSKNQIVTLSNIRVLYSAKKWGEAHVVSILLNNISSIEIRYKSYLVLVVLAIISAIITFVLDANFFLGISFSSICIALFLITRKHYLIISSNGGAKINLQIKGMKTNEVLAFLNQVEQTIINI